MNVLFIAWRELRATFTTVVGWLILASWLLLTSLFWQNYLWNYVSQSQNIVFDPYTASQLTLTDYLLGPWFGDCSILLVFLVPALTMRLFSEEMKQRTLELLLTSPVSSAEIVLGKFLGAMLFALGLLLATVHAPLSLYLWGSPDAGVLVGSYLGMGLLAAALVAMGTFASSLTSNQIVAMVITFAAALGLLLLQWLASAISSDPDHWLAQLTLLNHMNDLLRGAVPLSDLVFFVAFTGLFLFATHQRMESFRWN
jgi:ABC-2 type transport system permease protein